MRSGLENVRVRLAILVLIAAVPLLLLAGTIVWQNYRMALDVSVHAAARWRESAVARHEAAVGGAEQMLVALSQTAGLLDADPEACRRSLLNVLSIQQERYSNFALLGLDGAIRCSAKALSADTRRMLAARNVGLLKEVSATRSFTLGPVRESPIIKSQVIPAFMPLVVNGQLAGILYAGLRIDWFASKAGDLIPELHAVWIVDRSSKITQVATLGSAGLPPEAALRSAARRGFGHRGAIGRRQALRVCVGSTWSWIPAADCLPSDARPGGRGASAFAPDSSARDPAFAGADGGGDRHACGVGPAARPAEPGGKAMARGGKFDPQSMRSAPLELRELAQSFAEATRSAADHAARNEAAVAQQELLMKEIHHRVKNNLQIVASLLNLQASRIKQPEAKAEFASARDRVRALATLHRHLYSQGEVHTINMRLFLTELCGQLFAAMGEREGTRISLNIEASELQMSSDQAVPLSLIVTEAVSNALKYAFPNGRSGMVEVCLTGSADEAELTISDDGVGIPAGRAETEMGVRDGLGLTLIRGFARQLGATLNVKEDHGTTYSLVLPLRREEELAEV